MSRFRKGATYAETLGPGMEITDQAEADAYFKDLVELQMQFNPDPKEAESIARSNLGYYAGYYDDITRERVERLFKCKHPVFGSIAENGAPTPEQAFAAGVAAAKRGAP